MRNLFPLLFLPILACASRAPTSGPEVTTETETETEVVAEAPALQHFGEAFTLDEVISASTLLADPSPYVDQLVRVEGRVTDVCQRAGCWLVITDETHHMRIRTRDHGFAVDKQGTGSTCQVEGTVVAMPLDPETTEHFASESSEDAVLPENEATAEFTYEIVANAVQLQR